MFDSEIINQDSFLDISIGAKAIYFLLGIYADDEGFISPKKILRVYDGTNEMLKELIDAGYLISFESGIVVITDWHRNNYLSQNRIKETIYVNEKKEIVLDTESLKYERLTNVKPMLNQNSIVENSKDKNSLEKSSVDENSIVEISCVESKDCYIQKQIIDYLNFKLKSDYKYTDYNFDLINKWLNNPNNKYGINEFKLVIDKKYDEWINTDMQRFLTPGTLFGNKFEQYLAQPWKKKSLKDIPMETIDLMIEEENKKKDDGDIFDPFTFC